MSVIHHDTPSGRGFPPGSFQVYTSPWTDDPFPEEDKALVEVTFPFRSLGFPDWDTLRFFVPLDENLYTLSKKIQKVCDEAKSKQATFLRGLHERYLDVRGEATIWSPDDEKGNLLGLYANMTPYGRLRVEKVRDLFTSPELKKGHLTVHVRVWLTVIEKPKKRSILIAEPLTKTYIREAKPGPIDAGQLAQAKDSPHSPLVATDLHQHEGPCAEDKCYRKDALSILEREINGMQIGSVDHAEWTFKWSDVYLKIKPPPPQSTNATPPIPELPNMTFNSFIPEPSHNIAGVADYFKKHADQRIHLAIRMVNRLPSSFAPEEVELPANVLMSVKHGVPQQEKLICKTLTQSLEKFAKEKNQNNDSDASFAAALFQEAQKAKWKLELWIMPQTGSKKLYRFKGGLANFLDIREVEGKGNTKLYMEAHIVPEVQIEEWQVLLLEVGMESENESEDEYARREGEEIRAQRALERSRGNEEEDGV